MHSRRLALMISKAGASNATNAKIAQRPLSMCRAISMATTIWTTRAIGKWGRSMDAFGFNEVSLRDGHPITSGIGYGSRRGAGYGLAMSPGASRRFTTDDGRSWAATGDGCPGRSLCAQSMHLHSSRLWAAADLE